ncbi:MAG: hypothetical protein ACE365_07960 [Gammaproteobacteria bacterium]
MRTQDSRNNDIHFETKTSKDRPPTLPDRKRPSILDKRQANSNHFKRNVTFDSKSSEEDYKDEQKHSTRSRTRVTRKLKNEDESANLPLQDLLENAHKKLYSEVKRHAQQANDKIKLAELLINQLGLHNDNTKQFAAQMTLNTTFYELLITHLYLAVQKSQLNTVASNTNLQDFLNYAVMLDEAIDDLTSSVPEFYVDKNDKRYLVDQSYLNAKFHSKKRNRVIFDSEEKIKIFLLTRNFLRKCEKKINDLESEINPEVTAHDDLVSIDELAFNISAIRAKRTLETFKDNVMNYLESYLKSENTAAEFKNNVSSAFQNNKDSLNNHRDLITKYLLEPLRKLLSFFTAFQFFKEPIHTDRTKMAKSFENALSEVTPSDTPQFGG